MPSQGPTRRTQTRRSDSANVECRLLERLQEWKKTVGAHSCRLQSHGNAASAPGEGVIGAQDLADLPRYSARAFRPSLSAGANRFPRYKEGKVSKRNTKHGCRRAGEAGPRC